ncbi:hypothetical protein EJB05_45888, partial [Eragrostis curvula]
MAAHTPSSCTSGRCTPSACCYCYFTSKVIVPAVFSLLLLVAAGGVHAPAAAATTTPTVAEAAAATVPVTVGVILDLATELGKRSLLSVEMALKDFYAAHPDFATRVSTPKL